MPPTTNRNKLVQVRVNEVEWKKLEKLAHAQGVTKSDIVRMMLYAVFDERHPFAPSVVERAKR